MHDSLDHGEVGSGREEPDGRCQQESWHEQPQTQHQDAFGALKLTETARGVLKGETEIWLREQAPGTRNRASRSKSRRGDLAPLTAGPAGAANPALVTALRAWRSEVARQRGMPAYVVLHDSTIEGIAAARPATLEQLRRIAGIGDAKLKHYGEALLALVRSTDV